MYMYNNWEFISKVIGENQTKISPQYFAMKSKIIQGDFPDIFLNSVCPIKLLLW